MAAPKMNTWISVDPRQHDGIFEVCFSDEGGFFLVLVKSQAGSFDDFVETREDLDAWILDFGLCPEDF